MDARARQGGSRAAARARRDEPLASARAPPRAARARLQTRRRRACVSLLNYSYTLYQISDLTRYSVSRYSSLVSLMCDVQSG